MSTKKQLSQDVSCQEIFCALLLEKIVQLPVRTQMFNLKMVKLDILFTETNGSRDMVFTKLISYNTFRRLNKITYYYMLRCMQTYPAPSM